jgi:chromosome segregation ATPase
VSKSGTDAADAAPGQVLAELEGSVSRLLGRLHGLQERLETSETRERKLEEILERLKEGESDPVELQERVHALEAENRDLKERLNQGRDGVKRLLARIRFLEEQG